MISLVLPSRPEHFVTMSFVAHFSMHCPPSTTLNCLGVEINTADMTLSITSARLNELEGLLLTWLTQKSATKSELQSLVGKLSFVSRILALLRTVKRNHHHVKVSREFYRDILWWLRFIHVYNSISIVPTSTWSSLDAIFATDACLLGLRWTDTSKLLSY